MDEKEEYLLNRLNLNESFESFKNNVSITDEDYYSLKYYLLNTYYWSSISNKAIWEIFQKLTSNVSHYSNLLDFGCGIGLYTDRLKKISDTYTGVDISNTAINIAKYAHKDKNGLKFYILNDFIGSISLKADMIFCSETLDHVKNPQSILDTFYSALNDDGQIFITTTTLYHYIFRILFNFFHIDIIEKKNPIKYLKRIYIYISALFSYKYRPKLLSEALERSDHVNAFSLRELKYLAKKSGLKVIEYSYFNCKDLIPSKRYAWINNFIKGKLRISKLYGQSICILLAKDS